MQICFGGLAQERRIPASHYELNPLSRMAVLNIRGSLSTPVDVFLNLYNQFLPNRIVPLRYRHYEIPVLGSPITNPALPSLDAI